MIGAILGDIIGSRFGGKGNDNKEFKLFTPKSTITDNTVITCAVAEALMSKGENETLPEAVVRTMHEIGQEYPDCGYSGYLKTWILEGKTEPYNSFGDNSAMRISPVAFAYDDYDEMMDAATAVSEVTHNHWEGIKGAQAAADVIWMARHKVPFEIMRKKVTERYYRDEIHNTEEMYGTCMLSVPSAILAFLDSESFEDAVRRAVVMGVGSRAVPCMAGAMAEAYFGVPEKLQKQAMTYLDDRLTDIVTRFEER